MEDNILFQFKKPTVLPILTDHNIDVDDETFIINPKSIINKVKSNPTISKVESKVEDVGKEGIMGIEDLLKELLSYLKDIGKFFKSWDKIVEYMKNPTKAIAMILTITLPVIGQIIARFMLFNGSMDHIWLLLFSIPPLTLVPALAMIFGYIKPLEGGAPWDNFVLIPILMNILGTFLQEVDESYMYYKYILTLGSFVAVYWYKSTKECKEGTKMTKVLMDSMISYILVITVSIILPYLPFVGSFFEMIQALIPRSDLLFEALVIFFVYVGTNIINGSFTSLCKDSYPFNSTFIMFLVTIIITVITWFSPGNFISIIERRL